MRRMEILLDSLYFRGIRARRSETICGARRGALIGRAGAQGDNLAVLKLQALRGIGLVTACALRAKIGCFDRFRSGEQAASPTTA